MAVTLLTVTEYARHRGCDEKAVRKAIDAERITVVERDGRRLIDPDVADIQWARNTRSRVRRDPGAGASSAQAPANAEASATADAGPDAEVGDTMSYQEASRVLKIEDARVRRIERQEAEKRLTDAADAARAVWTAFRTLRDTVMPLGRRVASKAAHMTDPREIQLMVDAEVRTVLMSFRDKLLAPVVADLAQPGVPDDAAVDPASVEPA